MSAEFRELSTIRDLISFNSGEAQIEKQTPTMGNKPIHSLTMDDIPEDPGVVLLLTAASLRSSCTEEERRELCDMATRLRTSKRRLLEEKLAHPASNIEQIKNYFVAPRVDDFREYHLHDQLRAHSINRSER